MKKGLKLYMSFIDELTAMHLCVNSHWVLNKGYPEIEDNKIVNSFLQKLSQSDKQILASMLQDVYDSGIHDTLSYLDEKIEGDNLVLSEDGTPYITDTFDSMHFDFICRSKGDSWPEK